MALTLYTAVYVVLSSVGLLVLRRSLADASLADLLASPGLYLGGLCYAASFVTFLGSLRRFEVLTVYPLFTGLGYAAVSLASVVVLNESLTASRVVGIALIGAGVLVLVR